MAFGLYSDLREVFAQPRLEDWLEDSSPSEDGRRSHRSRDLRIQQADELMWLVVWVPLTENGPDPESWTA